MPNQTLTAPLGFRVAAVKAGIKTSGNLDLGLIVADVPCSAAGTFTTNKIVAPAVITCRKHLRSGKAQAIFVNAGNANTCAGGEGTVETICRDLAQQISAQPHDVLVCSTGIIGQPLPIKKVRQGIKNAAANLSRGAGAGHDLARAIMTTDTKPKVAYQKIKLGAKTVHLAGTAKGSGMIAPNMATMLAFITTDADISSPLLRRALKDAIDITFNKVTIDNHMSTSDSAIVLASGMAQNKRINTSDADYRRFAQALWQICDDLARQMAADGEGATCAVTVQLTGAATHADAYRALRAIVDSPLVRCAFNGGDPNWGRIVSAVGYSGAKFHPDKITCKIAGTTVFANGCPRKFDAAKLSRKMKAKQWDVLVDLAAGPHRDFCYTCDLSRQYVTINADYHS